MVVTQGFSDMFKGTLPQLLAVFAGTFCALSDGMHYGWSAPVVPKLMAPDSPLPITKLEGEWLETVFVIGGVVGLWPVMYLADKIGRKKSILLSSFLSLIVWITISVAPSIEYLLVARSIAGAVTNITFVAAPMYIAEIANQNIRGFLSSFISFMMMFGIVVIYSITPFFPFYAHSVLGAVLVFIQLVWFPFMPDSPYHLIINDKTEDARKSLKTLRPIGSDIDKEIEQIKIAVERQKADGSRFLDLFRIASNRKSLSIMVFLNFAQQFSSLSVLLMNMHIILNESGSYHMDHNITAILFSVMMLVATSIGSFLIDKCGRKMLIISSSFLSGLCLLTLAVYFNLKNYGFNITNFSWIPIVCVMAYAFTFKFGLGMVPIVMTAEIFSSTIKAFGMALADGSYVAASLLTLQVYQRLTESHGLQYPFYIFSVCCFCTVIFTYYIIPETKGKTLDEIQLMLKGKFNKNASV